MAEGTVLMVGFAVGGFRFAMEAAKVAGMVPAATEPAGPLAMESLLGFLPDVGARRVLVLRAKDGVRKVSVAGDVGLSACPAGQIHPLPTMVAARMRIPGVVALALDGEGPTIVVDPARLGSLGVGGEPQKPGSTEETI